MAMEILKAQEIIGMQEITEIPTTPEYVKGVINLRGKIVPVVDLRLIFGMQKKRLPAKHVFL
jgi:purine-binding chemotaxis protein CheW